MKYDLIMCSGRKGSSASLRCGERGVPHAPPTVIKSPASFFRVRAWFAVSAALVLSQHIGLCSALPRPSREVGAIDCSLICNSSDQNAYRPQACTQQCPGYQDGLTYSSHIDNKRLQALEQQLSEAKSRAQKTEESVAVLQTRTSSLLVMVVLLAVLLLLLVPLIIYRTSLINYFFPICCSSNYNKQQTVKKKGGRRSRRGGAPPTLPTAPRSPDSAEQGALPEGSTTDTVITNGPAVRMATLAKEQLVSSTPNTSRDVDQKRQRHPSESSCTAEVGPISGDPNSSFGDQSSASHAYYNYGCSSSSTLAISPTQSRASATSGPVMPLSASALLASSHTATPPKPDQREDSVKKYSSSAEKYIVRDSTPKPGNSRVAFDRSMSRRPSSPESPTDGTTFSNITMATTLSSGTLTPDV